MSEAIKALEALREEASDPLLRGACVRAITRLAALPQPVDYDPAASKDHGEAKLAERDALLVRAEATIERYRTVMESICATGLAMGRSDVDNVVRESWETLKAIREHVAGGRGA